MEKPPPSGGQSKQSAQPSHGVVMFPPVMNHSHSRYSAFRKLAFAVTTSALLVTGCSNDSDDDDTESHSDTDITSSGRLVVYQPDDSALSVLDIDAEANPVLDSFALTGEVPSLYASPGNRYAAVIQRTDGLVSFLDSGLYTEDHGDHLHDYAEDPAMLDTTISGSRPTHFTVHEDHAALFFDAEEGLGSSVTLLDDAAIGAGSTVAELALENNMHGVAKLIDDSLFVTYRDPSITDTTLPDEVDRYGFDDGALSFEHRYTEQCPGLHGSAATDDVIAFGCTDGVLAIDLQQTDMPATHLGNPVTIADDSRIGSLYSHHDVDLLVAVAGSQFFVVDTSDSADPYLELGLPEGVSNVAQGFSYSGETFYVLGDNGNLHLFNTTTGWLMSDPITVTTAPGEDDISPLIAPSQSEDVLYLLETGGSSIKAIDAISGETQQTISLDSPASRLLWLGLADSDDHEHAEE